eukprot:221070-Amphidinium_carterae.1
MFVDIVGGNTPVYCLIDVPVLHCCVRVGVWCCGRVAVGRGPRGFKGCVVVVFCVGAVAVRVSNQGVGAWGLMAVLCCGECVLVVVPVDGDEAALTGGFWSRQLCCEPICHGDAYGSHVSRHCGCVLAPVCTD